VETSAEVATVSNELATSEVTATATSESETPESATAASNEPEKKEDVLVPDTPVEEIGSHGEVSSIETDTPLHKEGDTIEIGVTSSADANNSAEA